MMKKVVLVQKFKFNLKIKVTMNKKMVVFLKKCSFMKLLK
jgi:hypothetical protein